ncbi:hypothetical protein ISN44_As10g032550 [Arabidopsis suecica]|uniref:Uncharacterized protein n=1 Tax=Arabidopsis suecica TaxID=45249 RepID=A0A8T2A2C4_ARASU|nr:hypothetical protein ISN44_As10g032550 [Arabidopsis suecica]
MGLGHWPYNLQVQLQKQENHRKKPATELRLGTCCRPEATSQTHQPRRIQGRRLCDNNERMRPMTEESGFRRRHHTAEPPNLLLSSRDASVNPEQPSSCQPSVNHRNYSTKPTTSPPTSAVAAATTQTAEPRAPPMQPPASSTRGDSIRSTHRPTGATARSLERETTPPLTTTDLPHHRTSNCKISGQH